MSPQLAVERLFQLSCVPPLDDSTTRLLSSFAM